MPLPDIFSTLSGISLTAYVTTIDGSSGRTGGATGGRDDDDSYGSSGRTGGGLG